ncbi:MAG TPA: HAMP domain-containing sensor histidine kinase [Bacteroidales bacterium]
MKNRFQIIIILMAISLFGIILIQALWIRKTIQAEEARFDKAVFNSLNNTISGLERRQIFHFIDKKIDLPRPPTARPYNFKAPKKRNVTKYFGHDSLRDNKMKRNSVVVFTDTARKSKTIVRLQSSVDDTAIETIDINYSIDTNIFIKNEENFIFSGDLDSLQMLHFIDQEDLRWEQEEIVREKMDEFNKSMEQWVFEYSFDEGNLIGDFLIENIDSIISRALANNGIRLNFLSQIVKEEEDTTEVIWSENNQSNLLQNQYKTELFPNDFFRKNLFLVIDFPGKTSHIYRSVSLLIAGSFVFTLVILITFGFTLYFIQKQKKLSDIKSDFINNMTHEFKTPIATISLASDALGSPKVFGKKESTDYYLDIIKQENKRMNMQVEKVLQMSLIENHDFQLDIQVIDMHSIIENVAHVAQLPAQEKKGRIVTVLKATQSHILGDEMHLANIINNLIDNALKYNEKAPEILIETYNKENKIYVRISDNGVGMSKDIQKHIFDKFYRKPSGNIHNVKGFGLGLSYVKAIVQEHKGTIEVSSEPGNGSVFTLSFASQEVKQ